LEKEQFLEKVGELLETDQVALTPEFILTEDKWDSVAIISTMVLIDDFYQVGIDGKILFQCKTIADLLSAIDKKLKEPSANA
jgi:acyl carrier protein